MTIKEMAIERAPYTKEDSWNRIKACINTQTSFESGANTVLEEIEKAIASSDNPLTKLDAVVKVIEELKGK